MPDIITFNGFEIEVEEVHPDIDGLVRFKLQRDWSKVEDAFIPNCTVFQWVKNQGGVFWDQSEKKAASNSALRRFIEQGIFRFNGKILKPDSMLNFPVISVIMFPKSENFYSTIW